MQEDYKAWRLQQLKAGQPADWLSFYQAYPKFLMEFAIPEYQNQVGGPTQQFAEGGPVHGMASNPLSAPYTDYAARAQRMGLPVVPFETFSQLRSGATQRYAQGGPVAGKMVVDTDPNAPVDSSPAEIDGQQPAALNSGEFVMPTDVVAFYGTDRLQKMIAAARKGAQEGAMAGAA
jgi:hypothetical protein